MSNALPLGKLRFWPSIQERDGGVEHAASKAGCNSSNVLGREFDIPEQEQPKSGSEDVLHLTCTGARKVSIMSRSKRSDNQANGVPNTKACKGSAQLVNGTMAIQ